MKSCLENFQQFTYPARLKVVDVVGSAGIADEDYRALRESVITEGDFELYEKLVKQTHHEMSMQELLSLGNNALGLGKYDDARKSFMSCGKEEMLDEIQRLERDSASRAFEKERKMPEGFVTKNLLGHGTVYENLPAMLLGDGILSGLQMKQKYGKQKRRYGNDMQVAWCAYDHISVWDPWSGCGTREDDKTKGQELANKRSGMISDYIGKYNLGWKGIEGQRGIWKVSEKCADLPEYADLVRAISEMFEEAAERRDDPPDTPYEYDWTTKKSSEGIRRVDPTDTFITGDTEPMLIIDPSRKRYVTYNSGFGLESFVKTQILPEEIVGLVISGATDEVIINSCVRLAKQSGTPVYLSQKAEQAEGSNTGNTFEKLWPIENGG